MELFLPEAARNGKAERPVLYGPDGKPIPLGGQGGDDSFALPHPITFSSLWNSAYRIYSTGWDEAYKHSRENALSMRRDCWLMSLLRERQLAVAQLNWHLEPEDKKDPYQKQTADQLTKIIRSIPNFQRIVFALTEAIWYGRYGVQVVYGKRQVGHLPVTSILKHKPVNGDKIQYRYKLADDKAEIEDDTPAILIQTSETHRLKEHTIVNTDRAQALLLDTPYWRQKFLIHSHEIDDSDFFEAELAGGVHGVGIRSRIYWMDWLRKEWLSWITDFIERVGMGLMIYYYEAGNPKSKSQAEDAAQKQSRNAVIVWPRPIGQEKQGAGVERLEVPMSGSEMLVKLQEHIEEAIERYIVGQTGSSRSETSGLGTHDTDFMQDTKYRLTKFDAQNLEETLTAELVNPHKEWNCPEADFQVYFRFDIDKPDADKQLWKLSTEGGRFRNRDGLIWP